MSRDIGLNKVYNLIDTKDIVSTTVYYIGENNDNYYYVPVTKIENNSSDKIKIIIDELSSGPTFENNLMSFLNVNTELLNYEIKDKSMYLTFNDYILNSIENKNILEEVLYTICLSIEDNYDVEEVVFILNDEEISKSVLKTLE